ncbi:MAG: 3-oxoadipate enol-lactonase [Anaerolineaceae bacterium 4572_32.2]|nr:MAG: 3-oxoadipate enol-lactonase [Anaerolineaceae bacterium 4572_32.2]HEY72686.1 alpha/beta fold hydrolase [Thermoflexia bacterium]
MPKLHLRDIDLYYETTGEGQPILFIHGLGSSGRDWEPQIAFFSQSERRSSAHYQIVTFDVRGHGQSDKPPGPYSIRLFADDTAELIKALDIAPAHVVGISMGGMIAFQLAVSAPDLVKSLTIVNSAPELVLRSFEERLRALQRLLITHLLGMRKMGQVLSERLLPKPEHAELRRIFVERWAENDKRAYIDSMKALVGWSVADRLGDIRCPTLVIAADEDYTPMSLKEAYVAQIEQAELVVIQDSRHATPVEQPEQFNQALMTFLARQV